VEVGAKVGAKVGRGARGPSASIATRPRDRPKIGVAPRSWKGATSRGQVVDGSLPAYAGAVRAIGAAGTGRVLTRRTCRRRLPVGDPRTAVP